MKVQRITNSSKGLCKKRYMRGFMTLKGYMKASVRLIKPFEGFIILRLFFKVYADVQLASILICYCDTELVVEASSLFTHVTRIVGEIFASRLILLVGCLISWCP